MYHRKQYMYMYHRNQYMYHKNNTCITGNKTCITGNKWNHLLYNIPLHIYKFMQSTIVHCCCSMCLKFHIQTLFVYNLILLCSVLHVWKIHLTEQSKESFNLALVSLWPLKHHNVFVTITTHGHLKIKVQKITY